MSVGEYVKETKEEMKHVSWPSRKQVVVYTIVVIIVSAVVAVYLGALDYLFRIVVGALV